MRGKQSASARASSRPTEDNLFRVPPLPSPPPPVFAREACVPGPENLIKIFLCSYSLIFVPLLELKHDAQCLVAGELEPWRKEPRLRLFCVFRQSAPRQILLALI